jgi:hypothetical protein
VRNVGYTIISAQYRQRFHLPKVVHACLAALSHKTNEV